MNLIEKAIQMVSPKWAFERQAYRNAIQAASTQYAGAARTANRSDWYLGAGTATPPAIELTDLRDRSRDENRNNPLVAGITGTYAYNIAGTGLKLQSKLRASVLGISEEQADLYRQEIEDGFDEWCKNPDMAGRLDFDEFQTLVVLKMVEDGDVLTNLPYREAPERIIGRALELISGDRLGFKAPVKNPDGSSNDSGVILGSAGEAVKYSILKAGTTNQYEEIEAKDPEGRPKILHSFRTHQPGQLRGVPLIAPIMTLLKDFAGVMEATVMRARVAACLAVIFTKANPAQAMLAGAKGSIGAKPADPSKRLRELFPGMIEYMDQGDTASMLDPAPDGSSFDPFVTTVLKLCCAAINLPYELVVKDFSKSNYSSARAAILEGRRVFTNWRRWLGRKWCQPIFELVLEELVYSGIVKLPKFEQFKREYCRAMWIGGGWGWVDPVKEIEASNMAIESGLSTLADECAGNGKDWEENLSQRKREKAKEEDAGVFRTVPIGSSTNDQKNQPQPQQQANARRQLILKAALSER